MNLLISSLGSSPDIIEETLGLFNVAPGNDFYHGNSAVAAMRIRLQRVDQVWLVATDQPHSVKPDGRYSNSTIENFEYIKEHCAKYNVSLRLFILDGVPDISSEHDARAFHDLLLRVVAFARQKSARGKLYLSLACGRKTMSADMHDAAYCFGCDQLLHILGDDPQSAQPLLMGTVSRNEAIKPELCAFEDGEVIRSVPQSDYLEHIEQQKQQSQHFFTSYYLDEKETRSNFHILYTLPPSKIEQLKNERIGVDPKLQKKELAWLKRLPKSDLHCHLGGVLNIEEIVEVSSNFLHYHVEDYAENNRQYRLWLRKNREELFHKFVAEGWKKSVTNTVYRLGVPRICVTAPLLAQFRDREEDLKKLWYNNYVDEKNFCGIGIETYEQLGDLQGSSLLDSLQSLEATIAKLLNRCYKENVRYLEIRCSPFNYANNEIPALAVVITLCNLLQKVCSKVETSLIFIISRHRDNIVPKYVELVNQFRGDEQFRRFFRGFDLAGNESIRQPEELRQSFIDIMRGCYNITIHAGETEYVENIWQAVYHLNAERVGHGLHLLDDEDLLTKFLERGIGIEMCPSSNFQIVGFRDNYFPKETARLPVYPLKQYLDKELKVSVNTDDPGISLTDMTHELHKAARMTPDGLSKWDIIQLVCNGFRSAFYPYELKKQLIRKVEKELGELIQKGEL